MDLQEQYDKLLRYCYMKTKDRYVAEDIVQETFLRYWQNHTYKDSGKELAYLYTIARNLCVDEFRRHETEDIQEYPDLAGSSVYEPEENIDSVIIEQALDQLSDELKEIVVLRYTNEVSVKDIANITGLSRFAVRRRIKEGLNQLRTILEKGEQVE